MTGLRRTWWLPLLGLGMAACHSTESRVPTTVTISPTSSVSFTTRGRSRTLHAAVLDQNGDTVLGRTFTWASNNLLVANVSAAAADSATISSVGSGTATVTVTSGSLHGTVNVSVLIVAASAVDSGDMQVGAASTTLGAPLVLVLQDSLGNPASADTVKFAVTSGGGSVGTATTVTTSQGRAVTSWTLGASGTQTVTATAPGLSYTFHAELLPAPSNPAAFNIVVVNVGSPFNAQVQAAFDSAAAFWGRAITGDLAPDNGLTVAEGDQGCGAGFPAVGPINVDDVVILALVRPIDGVGGILGGAGPCFIRVSNTGLVQPTILGAMEFDSADVPALITSGELSLVIKHEMAHVLGFGTFWPASLGPGLTGPGCLQLATTSAPGPDTYYNCPAGRAYFDSIGGTSYTGGNKVPVENCATGVPSNCGAGTWNSHWRESVFGTELMTGYLNGGVPNLVSKMTIAQFTDLGYTGVDVTKAEAYSQVFTAPSAFRLITGTINLGNDVRLPVFARTPDGRTRRIGRPPVW